MIQHKKDALGQEAQATMDAFNSLTLQEQSTINELSTRLQKKFKGVGPMSGLEILAKIGIKVQEVLDAGSGNEDTGRPAA